VTNLYKTWHVHQDFAWFADPTIQHALLSLVLNYPDRLERFVRRDEALLERYRLLRYRTFLHGDCHNGNIFYMGSEEDYAKGI
jgi:Ser/Thr protein kinase RdoA (MazF antagonist)